MSSLGVGEGKTAGLGEISKKKKSAIYIRTNERSGGRWRAGRSGPLRPKERAGVLTASAAAEQPGRKAVAGRRDGRLFSSVVRQDSSMVAVARRERR